LVTSSDFGAETYWGRESGRTDGRNGRRSDSIRNAWDGCGKGRMPSARRVMLNGRHVFELRVAKPHLRGGKHATHLDFRPSLQRNQPRPCPRTWAATSVARTWAATAVAQTWQQDFLAPGSSGKGTAPPEAHGERPANRSSIARRNAAAQKPNPDSVFWTLSGVGDGQSQAQGTPAFPAAPSASPHSLGTCRHPLCDPLRACSWMPLWGGASAATPMSPDLTAQHRPRTSARGGSHGGTWWTRRNLNRAASPKDREVLPRPADEPPVPQAALDTPAQDR